LALVSGRVGSKLLEADDEFMKPRQGAPSRAIAGYPPTRVHARDEPIGEAASVTEK
jgi:hypothetical protein